MKGDDEVKLTIADPKTFEIEIKHSRVAKDEVCDV